MQLVPKITSALFLSIFVAFPSLSLSAAQQCVNVTAYSISNPLRDFLSNVGSNCDVVNSHATCTLAFVKQE